MKERELSLIDLIVDILLRWRSIIVWMLVGALLMGGFSYVNSIRTASAQKAALEKQQAEWEEKQALLEAQMKDKETTNADLIKELTETQKNNVLNVLEYGKMKAFYEASPYLQMDAAKVPKVELSYLVKSSVLDNSYSIERLYEDTLESGLQQWLAESDQNQLGDISELVSLDRATGTVESDSFNVQVIHVSEELCKELAQQVTNYIAAQQLNIAQQAGRHEVVLVNQTFAFVRDNAVLNQQKTLWSNITNVDTTVDKAIGAFSEEEKAYYEFLTHVELEEEEAEAEQSAESETVLEKPEEIEVITPGISIKYVILGMILFAFIWVFYLFLKYILNNKLRATDDIGEIYNVPQLGRIPKSTAKKKWFDFVDRLILQLRDRNRRTFTAEEATGLAGVAVKIAAKKESFDVVCCIGCDMKEGVRKVADAVQKTLKEENIELTVLNNVLYDQSAMEQLQGVKGAFLLEKAGETLYDEIVKELELLQRQDIKVLGVVVVE